MTFVSMDTITQRRIAYFEVFYYYDRDQTYPKDPFDLLDR